MLRLRPYKPCDAETIVTWIKDELTFRRWSWDRFGRFPITAEDINKKYMENNGDCVEPDNFYPMTAVDENGVAGHLILRFTDMEHLVLRFGFIIVDDSRRGMGYGKEMLCLALQYAFEILKVNKVTLGVFQNNQAAYHCYKSVGFQDVVEENQTADTAVDEDWKCLELELVNPRNS